MPEEEAAVPKLFERNQRSTYGELSIANDRNREMRQAAFRASIGD
jgi:hypothetical protein